MASEEFIAAEAIQIQGTPSQQVDVLPEEADVVILCSTPIESSRQDLAGFDCVCVDCDDLPAERRSSSGAMPFSRELDELSEKVNHIMKVTLREIEYAHFSFRSSCIKAFQSRDAEQVHSSLDRPRGTFGASLGVQDIFSPFVSPFAQSPTGQSPPTLPSPRHGSASLGELKGETPSRNVSKQRISVNGLGESEAVQTITFEQPLVSPSRGFHTMGSMYTHMGRGDTFSGGRRHDFKLLPEWLDPIDGDDDEEEEGFEAQMEYYANLATLHSRKFVELYRNMSDTAASLPTVPPHCCVVLHPSCTFRMFWDIIACLLLAYDFYAIPLGIFDIPSDGFFMYMSTIVMFYWSFDIVQTFFVGYFRADGELEMNMRPIARRYLKGWFLPDVLIVTVDWLAFLDGPVNGSAGILRFGKVSRLARIIRVLRLVRARRLLHAMEQLNNAIGMESTAIMLSICKNIIAISLMNHILAALWFWVGLQNEEEGWLADTKSNHWFDNYIMALSWSTANFTPGSTDIRPRTTYEYTFHVFSLFLALVIFSVFVSTTTSLITKLMNIKSAQTQKMWLLKGFLQQRKFPSDFRERVLRYVHTAIGSRKDMIQREDVELLKVLSKPLREEVQSICQLATLKVHPLMKLLAGANPAMMRTLCTEAITEGRYSRGDGIFTFGERMDKMSFVVAGVLTYAVIHPCEATPFRKGDPRNDYLGPLDYFCEAALWTKWHCRGTLTADADCELLDIEGPSFRTSVTSHHIMTTLVRQYAQAFIDDLNSTLINTGESMTPNGTNPAAQSMSQSPSTRFGNLTASSTTDLQKSIVSEGPELQKVLSLFQQWPRLSPSSNSGMLTSAGSGRSAGRVLSFTGGEAQRVPH